MEIWEMEKGDVAQNRRGVLFMYNSLLASGPWYDYTPEQAANLTYSASCLAYGENW